MNLEFVSAEEAEKWPEGTKFVAATNRQYGTDYHIGRVRPDGLDQFDREYPKFLRLPDLVPGVPKPPEMTNRQLFDGLRESGIGSHWDNVDDVDRELRRIRGCETYAEQFEDMTREQLLEVKADIEAAFARLPDALPELEKQ